MKKVLLILSLIAMRQIHGQTWVTIPDANFATYLQSKIPAAMSGNQMDTSSTLVTTTKHINVSNRGISNLFGVQYFSSLDTLECSWNKLTTLPILPNSLTYLYCANDSLISLPVLPISLIYLQCMENSLTNLPTLPNSLYYLDCASNSLMNLPALPSSLAWLLCNGNYLTTLPTLPSSLMNLGCNYNNITCFPNFPTSIIGWGIDPNPYNCLPNHTSSMSAADLAVPLCAAGNSNGCTVAGIKQFANSNEQVTIYPNPTSNQFSIEANTTDKLTLELYDVNGRLVLTKSVSGKSTIDVSSLNEGVYTISIISNEGVVNKKVVILR
ncbi:MAG TPA: T9SS type A sorting domain-containing protein [Bacteroidia bacterium]